MSAKNQDQPKRPTALEDRANSDDGRLFSPSSARNCAAIVDVWRELGVKSGRVLEIGSGTGQHAAAILKALPDLHWIASDFDRSNHVSICAWAAHEGVSDRQDGPLWFDAALPSKDWGVEGGLAALYCANMLHISPWEAGRGVVRGAGELLLKGGRLFLYGPYKRNGEHTSPSNEAFDASLKSRCAEWGVRDLESEVAPEAERAGFELVEIRPMPSNNLVVVFEKT